MFQLLHKNVHMQLSFSIHWRQMWNRRYCRLFASLCVFFASQSRGKKPFYFTIVYKEKNSDKRTVEEATGREMFLLRCVQNATHHPWKSCIARATHRLFTNLLPD